VDLEIKLEFFVKPLNFQLLILNYSKESELNHQKVTILLILGCLMYGPPGTGKTLIARALACNVDAKFIKVVASAIVDKYIG
jgi:ATP-dependent 26S proteasome regulatory subunit